MKPTREISYITSTVVTFLLKQSPKMSSDLLIFTIEPGPSISTTIFCHPRRFYLDIYFNCLARNLGSHSLPPPVPLNFKNKQIKKRKTKTRNKKPKNKHSLRN